MEDSNVYIIQIRKDKRWSYIPVKKNKSVQLISLLFVSHYCKES